MEYLLQKIIENGTNQEIADAINQNANAIKSHTGAINRHSETISGLATGCEKLRYGTTAVLILWFALAIFVILSRHNFNKRLKKLEI